MVRVGLFVGCIYLYVKLRHERSTARVIGDIVSVYVLSKYETNVFLFNVDICYFAV